MDLITYVYMFGAMLCVLFVCAAAYGVAFAVFRPVLALAAIPTYAGMIVVEYFSAFGSKAPKFLRFGRHQNEQKKFTMDFFAALCTSIGLGILIVVISTPLDSLLRALLVGDEKTRPLFLTFLVLLTIVYVYSATAEEDNDHPFKKLEKIGILELIKKLFGKGS